MFDILMAFWKEFFEKGDIEKKKKTDDTNHEKLPRMQRVNDCTDVLILIDSLRPPNNLSVMRDGSSWVEPVLN